MATHQGQRLKTAERRIKAIGMLMAGATYSMIADQLGYSSKGAAHKDLARALDLRLAEVQLQGDALRRMELARLETVQLAFWPAMLAGDVAAARTIIKAMEVRARITGLFFTSPDDLSKATDTEIDRSITDMIDRLVQGQRELMERQGAEQAASVEALRQKLQTERDELAAERDRLGL